MANDIFVIYLITWLSINICGFVRLSHGVMVSSITRGIRAFTALIVNKPQWEPYISKYP